MGGSAWRWTRTSTASRVELGLAVRRRVERLAQPGVAEIVDQQQPALEIAGEDGGRREAGLGQPSATATNGRGILVRRRRVHQHRLAPSPWTTRK